MTKRYKKLIFVGPNCELDPLKALDVIKAKMVSGGREFVAVVEWEKMSRT